MYLAFYENLIGNVSFPHHAYVSYKNEYEDECFGLAFLCMYPLCEQLSLFERADFFILLGDFNSTLSSSVHHYLLGDQTLLSCESKPYWNDMASAHAALNGYDVIPTLDFVNNPRWRGKNKNYVPAACDRIYLLETFNWENEFNLSNVSIFGKEISPKTGLAPSDHYGLLAEVEFTV